MLFNYENSELKNAESQNYNIYNTGYTVEWGIYKNPSDSTLSYTVLEEVFVKHKLTQSSITMARNLFLAQRIITDRKKELEDKENT